MGVAVVAVLVLVRVLVLVVVAVVVIIVVAAALSASPEVICSTRAPAAVIADSCRTDQTDFEQQNTGNA